MLKNELIFDMISDKNKVEIAKEAILKESEEVEGIEIKGYDFNKDFDFKEFLESYGSTGFQASHLAKAIDIIKKMREEKAFIYLGYTSNMVSSGIREAIRYLVEHKLVDVLVTTAGGIEEDFIKCLGDFKLGDFRASGKKLREKGINRIGNIFVPNARYIKFEEWVLEILKEYQKNASAFLGCSKMETSTPNTCTQGFHLRHKNEMLTPSKLIRILGEKINSKDSIYYWAAKNNIPVFSPAIMDGSLGDMIYFFKSDNPQFKLDITDDAWDLNNSTIGKKKTGMIILGGGVVKHSICNANLYRNGADYAVYINSNPEFDGSDSGAEPEEAKSWGKITGNGESVKVYGDATIIFPLVVAGAFKSLSLQK